MISAAKVPAGCRNRLLVVIWIVLPLVGTSGVVATATDPAYAGKKLLP
jgi:hypothetical protein